MGFLPAGESFFSRDWCPESRQDSPPAGRLAEAQPAEESRPHHSCICSHQVGACTLGSQHQSPGSCHKRKGPKELDSPLLTSLQRFTFVGFYGMGQVCEGGCPISAFRVAFVIKKVVSDAPNS